MRVPAEGASVSGLNTAASHRERPRPIRGVGTRERASAGKSRTSLAIYSLRIVALDDLRERLHPREAPSFRLSETIERLGYDLTLPLVIREGCNFAFVDLDNEDDRRSKVHRSHPTSGDWPSGWQTPDQ